jgi:hypothetical protein
MGVRGYTYSVHLFASSKDFEGLGQSHLVLNQSRVALNEPFLSREEHSVTSPRQEDSVHRD